MKRLLLALALFLPVVGIAQAKDPAESVSALAADSLSGYLQGDLGVTEDQAKGGVGAVLRLAEENLELGDFDRLASFIPGADTYMSMAESLGAVSGPVRNVAGLNAALGRLGMSPETIAKFVPSISDFLGKTAGGEVRMLLEGAMAMN